MSRFTTHGQHRRNCKWQRRTARLEEENFRLKRKERMRQLGSQHATRAVRHRVKRRIGIENSYASRKWRACAVRSFASASLPLSISRCACAISTWHAIWYFVSDTCDPRRSSLPQIYQLSIHVKAKSHSVILLAAASSWPSLKWSTARCHERCAHPN